MQSDSINSLGNARQCVCVSTLKIEREGSICGSEMTAKYRDVWKTEESSKRILRESGVLKLCGN